MKKKKAEKKSVIIIFLSSTSSILMYEWHYSFLIQTREIELKQSSANLCHNVMAKAPVDFKPSIFKHRTR